LKCVEPLSSVNITLLRFFLVLIETFQIMIKIKTVRTIKVQVKTTENVLRILIMQYIS